MQMTAIIVLLAADPDGANWFLALGYTSLYLAALLTMWSAALYLRAAWPELTARDSDV